MPAGKNEIAVLLSKIKDSLDYTLSEKYLVRQTKYQEVVSAVSPKDQTA